MSVYPTYYGQEPPVGELTWEELRPADEEYWRRVDKLQQRGGFYAYARWRSRWNREWLVPGAYAPRRTGWHSLARCPRAPISVLSQRVSTLAAPCRSPPMAPSSRLDLVPARDQRRDV